MEWEICASRGGNVVQKGTIRLQQVRRWPTLRARIPIEIPLPQDEGSFDLRFRLGENGSIAAGIDRSDSGARRPGACRHEPKVARYAGRSISIRATRTNIAGIERGSKARYGRGRITCGAASPRRPICAAENRQGRIPTVNWMAYRLELKHPQRPHRLVIEAGDQRRCIRRHQRAGTERTGRWPLPPRFGRRGRPIVGDQHRRNPARLRRRVVRRQVLFWPRVREPVLLMHDMGTGRRIEVANVEVHELAHWRGTGISPAASPVSTNGWSGLT